MSGNNYLFCLFACSQESITALKKVHCIPSTTPWVSEHHKNIGRCDKDESGEKLEEWREGQNHRETAIYTGAFG